MPAFKGSIEKSFGRKVLDGTKYLGKNIPFLLAIASVIGLGKFVYNRLENSLDNFEKNLKYYNQVNSSYDSLFKDAKTFGDSLAVYQHYGLPVRLPEPTLDEKETAVKINELEKSLK
jgi:hypothetical protein